MWFMNKYIIKEDLADIAKGATYLGSGGGGDTEYDLLATTELIEKNGPVPLLSVDELQDDDLIVPVGFIGAPLVSIEKLPSGKEFFSLLREIEKYYGRKPTALVAAEIGGSNAFAAIQAASLTGLSVVDADTLGRAFPRLEMSSCSLFGIKPAPAFIADSLGNTCIMHTATPNQLESYFRALSTAMGSSALVSAFIMTGKEAKEVLIRDTLSQAKALSKLGASQGKVIGSGVITQIEQEIQEGFLKGKITVTSGFSIHFQNEYLMVFQEGKAVATTPDIIALVNAKTGHALSVEQVKFGLAVDIVVLPAPQVWKTAKGLQLVGPKAFGYNIEYKELVL
jgi:uncharacterized protein